MRLTVFGCAPDEAALFRRLAPEYGVRASVTSFPLSDVGVALAAGSDSVSIEHRTPVANRTLLALRQVGVRYVSTRSAGLDHLDVAYANSIGIEVGNVAYSPEGVADYTLMLILMAVRSARAAMRRVEQHDYRLAARSRELPDLTVGVVGAGRIGGAVLERLRGFGCRVLAHDPRLDAGSTPLEELLRSSDVVTLHAPLTCGTHHLIDRRRIALLRPEAVVVNTSRGGLVDTAALVEALEAGRLGGAALDVVEGETGVFGRATPAPQGSFIERLQRLPNVVLSPHTAYYTDRALRDTVESTLANCLRFDRFEREASCLG